MRSTSRAGTALRVLIVLGFIGTAFGFQSVPNLVLYYKLEETASPSLEDSGGPSGTWQRITVAGQTLIAPSSAGDCAPRVPGNSRSIIFTKPNNTGALDVNGNPQYIGGGFVDIASSPAFSFTGPFTAMAWIKPTAFSTGENPNNTGAIIQKWDWNGVSTNGYGMNRDQAGTISFWMGNTAGNNILTTTETTPADQWSHVAIVLTSAGRQIFINGVLSKSDTYTTIGASNANLHIGIDDWARNFYGNVDEVRLYGRALSSGEIQALFNSANTIIGVTNGGPVMPPMGLLGQYYNNNVAIATTIAAPGSSSATASTTATLVLSRIDPMVNFDFDSAPVPGVSGDNFFGVWTGKVTTTAAGGNYTFGTRSDDGTRLWVNGTLVLDHWVGQPAPAVGSENMGNVISLTANTTYTIRLEFMEMTGNASSRLVWEPGGGPRELIPPYYLSPPDGPAAPTGLTATPSTTNSTPSVALSWNATVTAPVTGISYVLSRALAPGGPYTQVAVQPGLTFTDMGVSFGTGYYYVVQAIDLNGLLVGPASAPVGPATPVLPPITVSPTGPITTSESGTTATLTLTINQVPSVSATIQITSNNPNQAIVSGQGNGDASVQGPGASITINILAGTAIGTTFPITVQGVRDFIANGNQPYQISFVVNGGGWGATGVPTVDGTNLGIDVAGLLVNPTGGLITDTNGGMANFAVQLNSKPPAGQVVSVSLTSSNPTEGTVSPTTMTFTEFTWNIAQSATVTGQGVNLVYQDQPYFVTVSVNAGSDPNYIGMAVNVSLLNRHLEVPPALPHVWGGSKGSGGGCGLTGLEVVLVLGLGAAWRRRRRNS